MKKLADGRGLAKIGALPRQIADGEITDLSDWDDDELLRGTRRDKNGNFRGHPPKLIPAQCLQELNRRRFRKAYALLADSLVAGAEALREIIEDHDVSTPSDRLKAIELLFNRVMGLPKESIALELNAAGEERPFEKAFKAAIIPTLADAVRLMSERGDDPDGPIVEGEVVEVEGEAVEG
jgi:hypothetical protein